MKIAVLIYGRLNTCVEHYSNYIDSLGKEVDFFLSSDNSPENLLQEFIHLYKPISYTNEKINHTISLEKYDNKRGTQIHNMICHFINKQRVFELLEKHNETYDIVVSLRIDIVFKNTFDFSNIVENTIYIPDNYDWGGINDQVAYGNMEVMKKYNYIFKNIIYLLDNKLSIVHPETLTLANIIFNKLKINRFKLSYFIERR
jgi:hypothetical protein